MTVCDLFIHQKKTTKKIFHFPNPFFLLWNILIVRLAYSQYGCVYEIQKSVKIDRKKHWKSLHNKEIAIRKLLNNHVPSTVLKQIKKCKDWKIKRRSKSKSKKDSEWRKKTSYRKNRMNVNNVSTQSTTQWMSARFIFTEFIKFS